MDIEKVISKWNDPSTIQKLINRGIWNPYSGDFYKDCEMEIWKDINSICRNNAYITPEGVMEELLTTGIKPEQITVIPDTVQNRGKYRWMKAHYIGMLVQMSNTTVKIKLSKTKQYSNPRITLSDNSPWWRFEQKAGKISRFIIKGNEILPKINKEWTLWEKKYHMELAKCQKIRNLSEMGIESMVKNMLSQTDFKYGLEKDKHQVILKVNLHNYSKMEINLPHDKFAEILSSNDIVSDLEKMSAFMSSIHYKCQIKKSRS